MLKNEYIFIQDHRFEVSFELLKKESGINHTIATTTLDGKPISVDDDGLGKNAAMSKLRHQLEQHFLLKKAA